MYPVVKRSIDIVGAGLGLIVLSPLLAVVTVNTDTNETADFFIQIRPGYKGKPFEMVRFRIMSNKRNSQGNLLPDEQRFSSMEKFLRKTSLDEFPKLFNVLKGDMSLVGPRPLLMQYLKHYTPEQARRHEGVCPGTGIGLIKSYMVRFCRSKKQVSVVNPEFQGVI